MFAGTSTRTPINSRGTTVATVPGPAVRSGVVLSARRVDAATTASSPSRKSPTDRLQLAQLGNGLGACLRIALTQERLDELFEQTDLPIGSDTPAAEVPRLETGIEESLRHRGDLDGVLVEERVRDDSTVR